MEPVEVIDQAQELEIEQREAAIRAVRAQVRHGQASAETCEDCGDDIPEARRLAIPGCVRCVYCQQRLERLSPRLAHKPN